MTQTKWVTLSVTEEELSWLDGARSKMEKLLGMRLSRNAFVKRLLFASELVEEVEQGETPRNIPKPFKSDFDGQELRSKIDEV